MKLDLNVFNKQDLIRACQLIGYKNKNGCLSKSGEKRLKKLIYEKVNPKNLDIIDQYRKTLGLLKIEYSDNDRLATLKTKLYKFNCQKFEEAIKKMSKRKREKLSEKIENSLDSTAIDELKKVGRKGMATGAGILAVQGGAILITGSNLGVCMLLTTGLSGISGILGITFPFAAYTGAAVLGGKILAVAGFLTNPFVVVPLIGLGLYKVFKKAHNKQYIHLAGINYLIESKKELNKH